MHTSVLGLLSLLPPVATSSLALPSWASLPRGLPAATKGSALPRRLLTQRALSLRIQGVGLLYLCKGDVQKAIPALEHSVALCQEANFLYLFLWTASELGAAYTLAGRVAEALPLLEQAVQQATSIRVQGRQSLRVASLRGYPEIGLGKTSDLLDS